MLDPSTAQCLILDHGLQPPGWRWNPSQGEVLTTKTTSDHRMEPSSPLPDDNRTRTKSQQVLHLNCTRLSKALVETLNGQRRLGQLRDHFDENSFKALSNSHARLRSTSVQLASVHVQPRSDTCAEVTLRLATPQINYAAALRITLDGDKWLCTDLVIG